VSAFPLALLAVALLQEPEVSSQVEEVTLGVRVNHAIGRGVEWLSNEQASNGNWDQYSQEHPGGMASLVVYTLLKSGVNPKDPVIQKALPYILGVEIRSVYSASTRLLMLSTLRPNAKLLETAQQDLNFLVQTQTQGMWAYPWSHLDTSNAAFAILGFRAAHEMGLTIPEETLTKAAEGIWRFQDKETGGFKYELHHQPSQGMTAAMLGSLEILADLGAKSGRMRKILKKKKREWAQAKSWLAEHFAPDRNAVGVRSWTPSWQYPHLWAIERYAGFAKLELIGDHDWYQEGAAWLIKEQRRSGWWNTGGTRSLESTCFALLFLRRATLTQDPELATIYSALDKEMQPDEPTPLLKEGVPFVRDWMIAGPWQAKQGNELLASPPFKPQKLKNSRAKVARKKWEHIRLPAAVGVNLEEVTGRGVDNLLWALSTNLIFDAPLESPDLELSLWLALEDGWSVWLDGEQIAFDQRITAPIAEELVANFQLSPGPHFLLILVDEEYGNTPFSCRISSKSGETPENFRTHIAPKKWLPPKG
jgi:hypothetical protein